MYCTETLNIVLNFDIFYTFVIVLLLDFAQRDDFHINLDFVILYGSTKNDICFDTFYVFPSRWLQYIGPPLFRIC
jgi:hypothetical protein